MKVFNLYLIQLCILLLSHNGLSRETVSLDGMWGFRFATDDTGIQEKWFQKQAIYEHQIKVPSCWDNQGVLDSELRGAGWIKTRSKVGVGWYKREFSLPPEWNDKRIWLIIGATHRSCKVWLNDNFLGQRFGYSIAHKFDITPYIQDDGLQVLTVAVDSRKIKEDPFGGAFSSGNWGGIYESVHLESTNYNIWIEDVFVKPDPLNGLAEVEVYIKQSTTQMGLPVSISYSVTDLSSDENLLDKGCLDVPSGQHKIIFTSELKEAPLWTPDNPALLQLDMTLMLKDEAIDKYSVRFGQRRIEIRGNDFYLNGQRFMFRGYGMGLSHMIELVPPSDINWYRRFFRRRKEFGFNSVRCHTSLYPEVFFKAADEEGFFIQPEIAVNYAWGVFENNPKNQEKLIDLWTNMIFQYRNHPSIFSWCMANEMYEGMPMKEQLYPLAKKLDPTRPVIDSDGIWPYDDRSTADYYTIPFDEFTIPWGRYKNKFMLISEPSKPVVSHEMTNLPILPNPDDKNKYTGVIAPYWLEEMLQAAERQGISHHLPAMVDASERLQASLIKLTIESARLSPFIDGYHQWFFRDAWHFCNGIVNHFDEERALSAQSSRQFNSNAAILWDHDKVSYHSGEVMDLRIYISDFRKNCSTDIKEISVSLGKHNIKLKQPKFIFPEGKRGLIGPWYGKIRVPSVTKPEKIYLHAEAMELNNQWPIWIFPEAKTTPVLSDNVIISAWLTENVLDRLVKGTCVFITNEKGIFPTLWTQFKSGWFVGDDVVGGHSYGNMIVDHPAVGDFPHDGYGDLQMYWPLDERQVVMLDKLPVNIEPIIWCLDRPEVLRKKAYLWEAKVGKGKLLFSTMNFSEKVRQNDIATSYLYNQLLSYVQSDKFQPSVSIPIEWLQKYVEQFALPEPGKLLEGFAGVIETDNAKSEMAFSHRDKHSGGYFRTVVNEKMGLSYAVSTSGANERIKWKTASVPKDWPYETVSFVWAGSFSCKKSYNREKHFSVMIHGVWTDQMGCQCESKDITKFKLSIQPNRYVEFPFTKTSAQWLNQDVRLRFIQYIRLEQEHLGLFVLTVPQKYLKSGESLQLELTAKKGLNPFEKVRIFTYDDIISWELSGN